MESEEKGAEWNLYLSFILYSQPPAGYNVCYLMFPFFNCLYSILSPLLNLVVYQTDHRYKKNKKSLCKCINKVSAKEQNDRKKKKKLSIQIDMNKETITYRIMIPIT